MKDKKQNVFDTLSSGVNTKYEDGKYSCNCIDKEKQIEEMRIQRKIEMTRDISNGISGVLAYEIQKLAEHLISLNYVKLPEDSVVLSREEYEKVKYVLKYEPEEAIIRLEDLTKKNERLYSPHMFCSLGGCSGVRKGCNRTCKESWIVIERKETAEKIYKEYLCGILSLEAKEEFAKQFDVEIKEN